MKGARHYVNTALKVARIKKILLLTPDAVAIALSPNLFEFSHLSTPSKEGKLLKRQVSIFLMLVSMIIIVDLELYYMIYISKRGNSNIYYIHATTEL